MAYPDDSSSSFGSGWDTGSAFNQGGDFSVPDFGSFDASSYDIGAGLTQPQIGTQQTANDQWSQLYGAQAAPLGQGAAAPGVNPGGGLNPGGNPPPIAGGGFGGLGLPGILGLGGAGAGLLGTLLGGGLQSRQMPQIGTAQKAAINQAPQGLAPFAQGTSPLQMQQSQLLNALFQGQIPPQLANLVANAYQPAYQDAARRSVTAAQQAGFYDNPLSSPVGGNIMGPAAAQLQGQQSNSLLGLLQTIPGLYNTPVQQQIGAAQGQGNQLLSGAGLGIGQQNTGNLPQQIGAQVGGALQGAGQGIAQQQALQRQIQGQGGIGTTGSFY